MYRSIDKSFEDYLEKKQNVGITEAQGSDNQPQLLKAIDRQVEEEVQRHLAKKFTNQQTTIYTILHNIYIYIYHR